jgi:heme exporter protein D
MTHGHFVLAAYGVTAVATTGLFLMSLIAMHRAEHVVNDKDGRN